jgi:hypothetical protein
MAAIVRIALGLLILVAAVACAFDYRQAASRPARIHIAWREQLARRFRWAPRAPKMDDPSFRWSVIAYRVGFSLLLLLMGVALLASGIDSAFR